MKTIEERAENYASQRHVSMNSPNRAACYGYIAGAYSERQELLRWRNPKEKQPEDGATVLGKTSDPKQPFAIMKYYDNIWWIWAHPCWAGPSGEVIAWRPIYD
jgi:hypothetical protein